MHAYVLDMEALGVDNDEDYNRPVDKSGDISYTRLKNNSTKGYAEGYGSGTIGDTDGDMIIMNKRKLDFRTRIQKI